MNLFTYGSLMFDEVWSRLARCDYLKRPGRLHGFTRRRVHDDVYPVILKSSNGVCVDGVVYFGVGDEDLRRLDVFKGPAYDRQTHAVVVEGGEKRPAEVYVLNEDFSHLVTACKWDPQWFARTALGVFLSHYQGFR
ncbi:MAG: gamma-glutamylcyclotransferase [Phycisphaerae bacterium]|nr:gamma-glutamylcyclotransferase [Phycisphaerae bacterium]